MTILGSIANMAGLSDQVIAMDFLLAIKSAVQNYGVAITEVTSTDLRKTLEKQLNDAIDSHEAVVNFMLEKGYYHAFDIKEQVKEILKVANTALERKDYKN